jgi:hypothetical protein
VKSLDPDIHLVIIHPRAHTSTESPKIVSDMSSLRQARQISLRRLEMKGIRSNVVWVREGGGVDSIGDNICETRCIVKIS